MLVGQGRSRYPGEAPNGTARGPKYGGKYMIYKNIALSLGATILCLGPAVSGAGPADSGPPALLSDETIRQDNYLPDFSYAGYGNGLSALPAASGTAP